VYVGCSEVLVQWGFCIDGGFWSRKWEGVSSPAKGNLWSKCFQRKGGHFCFVLDKMVSGKWNPFFIADIKKKK